MATISRLASYSQLAWHAQRLRLSTNEQVAAQARRHLTQRLGKLRGLPQKLGQMLSVADSTPDNWAADLATLTDRAEPLPFSEIEPLLQAAWGRPLAKVLAHIEPHGHAASLGQVHRAITRDGREIAIKVQYPGIRQAIQTDLNLLGWLSVPLGNLRRGFDLSAYRQAILTDLEHELDYTAEAHAQSRFADWSAQEPALLVPSVVAELSTPTVLVSQWIEGDHWQQVQTEWSDTDRTALAQNFLRVFLHGLFRRGLLHADLHPGNVRFRRTPAGPQIVLYDFGCVFDPSETQRLALLRLIRAAREHNESPWPLFLQLGFKPELLEPLAHKLPAVCQVLLEPFVSRHPFDLDQWRLSERLADVLGQDRWNFRIAGPADLIFLLRAFHGLLFYLRGSQAPLSWHRVMTPILQATSSQLDQFALAPASLPACDFRTLARHLKIRVREGNEVKVQLTTPAAAIEDLPALLEEPLLARIQARGISLEQLTREVRHRGYAPGPVFSLEESPRQIDVWLE